MHEMLREAERARSKLVGQPTPWTDTKGGAARALVSEATIRRAVAKGELQAVRVLGRKALRFRESSIDAWLENGTSMRKEARCG